MNTVEALNALGKALCGDSFEVKPGLTDAETILEIAKGYSGGSGSGGGGGRALYVNRVMEAAVPYTEDPAALDWDSPSAYFIGKGLSAEDIALMTPCYEFSNEDGETVDSYGGDSDLAEIGAFRGISALEAEGTEGFVYISIYGDGGNSGNILPAAYNSATGAIVSFTLDDPNDPNDPDDPNDPLN